MRLNPEAEMQAAYFEFLSRYEDRYRLLHWIYAIPNGSNKSPAERYKHKLTGLTPGIWDVHIAVPRDKECTEGEWAGRWFKSPGGWLEFKKAGNYLSPEQRAFQREVIEPGGFFFLVARDWIEAVRFTFDYLGIRDYGVEEALLECR